MTPKQQYEAWYSALPPSEKKQARALGVDQYHDDGGKVFSPDTSNVPEQEDHSPSITAVAEVRDYVKEMIRTGNIFILLRTLDELGLSTGRTEVIRPALDLILKARPGEVRLEAECVALSLGLFSHEGITYTSIAERWSRSRQVIQTRVKKICATLGVQTTQCSKSVESREVYRRRNHRHSKKAIAPVIAFQAPAEPNTGTSAAA